MRRYYIFAGILLTTWIFLLLSPLIIAFIDVELLSNLPLKVSCTIAWAINSTILYHLVIFIREQRRRPRT